MDFCKTMLGHKGVLLLTDVSGLLYCHAIHAILYAIKIFA